MSVSRRREARLGWVFVAPAFVHLLVFALFPMLYALYISLFKWQLLRENQLFVGLQNYAMAFAESPFWNAMWNSARFTLAAVPLGMIVALAVAILVNQKLRGVTVFRTLFYIPSIASGVAIAMLWIYVYLPETGMINTILAAFGVKSIDFLNRAEWAMWALVFMSVWTGLGPRMVLFLAGLLSIPQTLYEAAELDGASKLRTLWSVTLPMLVPTTLFVLVTSTIGALQIFTPVYMMTKGQPEDTTDVVGYHIYTEAWVNFNVGLASAKSFVLLAVVIAISVIQFRMMRGSMRGYSAT
ncbi:MAG: sugar ABC transporter permease [Fimbriimonadaceae bacterium]|nr:sugar ABC transporter permease [Fimbriimonadaceae bacterium]